MLDHHAIQSQGTSKCPDAKLESLETQAGLIAAALSESAVTGPAENRVIDPYRSVQIMVCKKRLLQGLSLVQRAHWGCLGRRRY